MRTTSRLPAPPGQRAGSYPYSVRISGTMLSSRASIHRYQYRPHLLATVRQFPGWHGLGQADSSCAVALQNCVPRPAQGHFSGPASAPRALLSKPLSRLPLLSRAQAGQHRSTTAAVAAKKSLSRLVARLFAPIIARSQGVSDFEMRLLGEK